MAIFIHGGTLVNEGRVFRGSIIIEKDCITHIVPEDQQPCGNGYQVIDATGCFVIPGVIDEHVHFREPGNTKKEDLKSPIILAPNI